MRMLLSMFWFFLLMSPASAQWVLEPHTARISSVRDIHFVTRDEGWAVGSRGAWAHTSGGREGWTRGSAGVQTNLTGVFFVSPQIGWTVGTQGTILHTQDGGVSWKKQVCPVTSTGRNTKPTGVSLESVYFADALEGWIVGKSGTILHTVTGGREWLQQDSGTWQTLYDLAFWDREEGWIAGNGGTVLHTTSGGRTWERQSTGMTKTLRSVYFSGSEKGWVVGDLGAIVHTLDGGRTWEHQTSGTENSLYDVCFVNDERGWVVGDHGIVLYTSDGGRRWEPQVEAMGLHDPEKVDFRRIHFFDRDHGLLVDWLGRVWSFSDVSSLTIPTGLIAKGVHVVGGKTVEQHPWRIAGRSADLDLDATPGWIQPRRIPPNTNLCRALTDRGQVSASWRMTPVGRVHVVDGDITTGFLYTTRKEGLPRTGTLFVDLKGAFRVNRVRIRAAREDAVVSVSTVAEVHKFWKEDDPHFQLERLTVSVNDGDPGSVDGEGNPLLTPIWTGMVDSRSTVRELVGVRLPGAKAAVYVHTDVPGVEIEFPTQIARYIGLTFSNVDVFDIGEIEVYGEDNFVPSASFESGVIDFGDLADWGEIRWEFEDAPDTKITVRTRSGNDEDPHVYWRWIGLGMSRRKTNVDRDDRPLTREMYEALPEEEQAGTTTDLQEWSPWSAPYDLEAGRLGVPIMSPAPRRCLQFRIDFVNTAVAAGKVDFVSFEYSSPPAAHELLAEITPAYVEPARHTTFVYSIRPTILGDDVGFDALEILTPVPVDRIRTVRMDGTDIPFTHELLTDPMRFVVHFRRFDVRDSWGLLEVVFDSVVLRYGTEFVGRVFDSTTDHVGQQVVSGDVREEFEGDGIWVEIKLETPLIESVEISPNPFTPNGDGINDEATISYALLKLTDVAKVTIDLYDLYGRFVRRLYEGEDSEGLYAHQWDGRGEEGDTVSPGIYAYRIQVQADAGRQGRMGTVTVAY